MKRCVRRAVRPATCSGRLEVWAEDGFFRFHWRCSHARRRRGIKWHSPRSRSWRRGDEPSAGIPGWAFLDRSSNFVRTFLLFARPFSPRWWGDRARNATNAALHGPAIATIAAARHCAHSTRSRSVARVSYFATF